MKTKQRMRMEIKEISAEGTFEGILSPYNVVDLGSDLVEPGAFAKTIQEHGNEVPLLWQHDPKQPIGNLTLIDGPDALRVKGQLLMALPAAREAYLLIKARIVKGLSIGFDTVKDAVDGGVRRLKELRLWEGSIVTFPMALQALITSVKARGETKGDFNEELAEIQLENSGYQMMCALQCALGQLPWAAGMTRDEKVTAADATIQQFSAAFLAYLPAYIDYLDQEYGGGMETMSAAEIETKRMERKVGRTISAATKTKLTMAHEHVKSATESATSATELLSALIADEAGGEATTLTTSKAGVPSVSEVGAAETKSEPVIHSAAKILMEMRSLIPAA